ncbi:AbgT family transporter, partial [Streptococcus anginosus]|uniref:AbgT family transporter n=1 Tax=Streptococcus anginosus TaxID=1328 RepID=UPI00386C9A1C
MSALAIFLFITLFNFFVTSGSGKAIVAMPIISPLARMVGLNQQVAVLAYTLGDGLTNVFYPTSGYFMATIANAKI